MGITLQILLDDLALLAYYAFPPCEHYSSTNGAARLMELRDTPEKSLLYLRNTLDRGATAFWTQGVDTSGVDALFLCCGNKFAIEQIRVWANFKTDPTAAEAYRVRCPGL
jgi:hypothetical protein